MRMRNIWIGKIVNGGIIFRERGRIRRDPTSIYVYTWYIQALLGSNQEAIHIVTTKRSLYENGFDKECLPLAPFAILIGDRQLSIAPFPSICISRSSTTDVFKKTLLTSMIENVGKWKLLTTTLVDRRNKIKFFIVFPYLKEKFSLSFANFEKDGTCA